MKALAYQLNTTAILRGPQKAGEAPGQHGGSRTALELQCWSSTGRRTFAFCFAAGLEGCSSSGGSMLTSAVLAAQVESRHRCGRGLLGLRTSICSPDTHRNMKLPPPTHSAHRSLRALSARRRPLLSTASQHFLARQPALLEEQEITGRLAGSLGDTVDKAFAAVSGPAAGALHGATALCSCNHDVASAAPMPCTPPLRARRTWLQISLLLTAAPITSRAQPPQPSAHLPNPPSTNTCTAT